MPVRLSNDLILHGQNEIFYQISVNKELRLSLLKSYFSLNTVKKIFISHNLSRIGCVVEGMSITILEKDFFQETDKKKIARKKEEINSSLVIINNNDLGTNEARIGYTNFYNDCHHTIFIAWDWDNHHWLDLSTFLAIHSDIYAPAHHENLYLLSRHNWLTVGPVYCSSIQWSQDFLKNRQLELTNTERSSEPLGMHIPYARFNFRIQTLLTLNKRYPSIGFSSHDFHNLSSYDKLKQWCAFKSHWIAPVLNDIPIRIFDALITGGIPIVPLSLRFMPPICHIPKNSIVFYKPTDIVEPVEIIKRANNLFDQGGKDGIIERHKYAFEKHHGQVSILSLVDYVKNFLDDIW